MTTRHSSYKWNRLCAALERATEPAESYEEVKARLAAASEQDERALPFDKASDYTPKEGRDERDCT